MEQINLFIDKVQTDSELAAKLGTPGAENAEGIAAIAKEHGFAFTAEEWSGYLKQSGELPAGEGGRELSPDELEAVSGGDVGWKTSMTCWFEPSGATKVIDGKTWYKCTANCRTLIPLVHGLIQCHCHGKDDQCKDRFHHKKKKENCGSMGFLTPEDD